MDSILMKDYFRQDLQDYFYFFSSFRKKLENTLQLHRKFIQPLYYINNAKYRTDEILQKRL
jgi:hypothetical protein